MNENALPRIGTSEAAVLACVDLIARAVQISEERVAYYLDLYYQTRSRYESENGASLDTLSCRLESIEGKLDGLTVAVKVEGEAPAAEAAPDEPEKKPRRKPTPPAADQLAMKKKHVPLPEEQAAFKRETFARLTELRSRGVTVRQIEEASDGALSDGVIRDILESKYRAFSDYRALAAALDRCEEKIN